MTTQREFKSTATGSIDYAHYARRAHNIRSQDAWSNIDAITKAVRAILAKLQLSSSAMTKKPSNATDRAPRLKLRQRQTSGPLRMLSASEKPTSELVGRA